MAVLMLGSTGNGKSALGNFIVDRTKEHHNKPETKFVQSKTATIQVGSESIESIIIDMPSGIKNDNEKLREKLTGECKVHNKRLQQLDKRRKKVLEEERKIIIIRELEMSIEEIKANLRDKDSSEMVLIETLTEHQTRAWFNRPKPRRFEITTEDKIEKVNINTNGKLTDYVKEDHKFKANLTGGFMRKLHATITLETSKRTKYAVDIERLERRLEVNEKILLILKGELTNSYVDTLRDRATFTTDTTSAPCDAVATGSAEEMAEAQTTAKSKATDPDWEKVKPKAIKKAKVTVPTVRSADAIQPPKNRWHSASSLPNKQRTSRRSMESRCAKEKREPVCGIRRVWGTLKGCSCGNILSALQKFSSVYVNVEVRRKFKPKGVNGANTQRWWFLIRGEEPDLLTLDGEWGSVQAQTTWKLERCYKPLEQDTTQPPR